MSVGTGNKKMGVAQQLTAIASGIVKWYPATESFQLLGVNYANPAAVVKQCNDYAGPINAVATAVVALKTLRGQVKAASLLVRLFIAAIHFLVESRFGKSGQELLDFGFLPAKTPVARGTAVKATTMVRKARSKAILGTKGKNQKKDALAAANTPPALAAAEQALPNALAAAAASATPTVGSAVSSATPASGAVGASEPSATPAVVVGK